MSTRTQALLMLLFGVALLRLGTSDLLLRFVKPSARPLVIVAGAVMLLLAIWSLVVTARERVARPTAETEETAETADEHGHTGPSRAAWLIVLPVIAVLVIGPPALGRYTVNQRDPVAPVAVDEVFAPLPKFDPVPLRVFDFALRAASKSRDTLAGRTVQLTGFVSRTGSDGFTLARLVITCCAADAAPVTVSVHSRDAPALNAWVRVTGRYAGQSGDDADVPVLAATSITEMAAPAEPYD